MPLCFLCVCDCCGVHVYACVMGLCACVSMCAHPYPYVCAYAPTTGLYVRVRAYVWVGGWCGGTYRLHDTTRG